jgi:hypothetical protein
MNASYTHYSDVRVIYDTPKVKQIGDKTLVTVTVVLNSWGKSKDYYTPKFVRATFSGAPGERAKQLKKGDKISFRGCEEFQLGKDGRAYFDVNYAEGLVTPQRDAEEVDPPAVQAADATEADGFDW